tara:strand:- start:341 stop:595 length:255 start_codon:yes stop_codon:yes gene_type:complete
MLVTATLWECQVGPDFIQPLPLWPKAVMPDQSDIQSLLDPIGISAEPSLSMSATEGYSHKVPLACPPWLKWMAPVAPSKMKKVP